MSKNLVLFSVIADVNLAGKLWLCSSRMSTGRRRPFEAQHKPFKMEEHPFHLKGRAIGMWYAQRSKRMKQSKDYVPPTPEQRATAKIAKKLRDSNPQRLMVSRNVLVEARDFVRRISRVDLPKIPGSAVTGARESRLYEEQKKRIACALRSGLPNDSRSDPRLAGQAVRRESDRCMLSSTHLSEEEIDYGREKFFSRACPPYILGQRQRLPAWKQKELLVKVVRNNQVSVVSGETGCGKTTQVPQFILDDCVARGEDEEVNIICTQPRRISATSVAERVASERGENVADTIGYQIRLDAKVSQRTRILFCTTGILLRRLQGDQDLNSVTHIIVDEIHERTIDTDFLIIVLRDLLPLRPDLRIVLMSATLNAELFASYFGGCPIVHIPGFTYPVRDHFLEHALKFTGYEPDDPGAASSYRPIRGFSGTERRKRKELQERDVDAEVKGLKKKLGDQFSEEVLKGLADMQYLEEIPYELIVKLIEYIDRTMGEGAILVFLPGWSDISKLNDACMQHSFLRNEEAYTILPLHSSLPSVDQRRIFNKPPPGVRKIILSTNIAETSVTIDDVVYVIDSGRMKETTYDPTTNLACLQQAWISKANARQRRGRAGRVQPGVCFHLFSSIDHSSLKDYQEPEMLRTPLENLCLRVKALGLADVQEFLDRAIEAPDSSSTENALELLIVIGALDRNSGSLTPLGRYLANLPVDPRLGKMLLYAIMFKCVDPVLTIMSSLGYRNPFTLSLEKRKASDEAKLRFANGRVSDHAAFLSAYNAWRAAGGGARSSRSGYMFAVRNSLSHNTLCMIDEMKGQFLQLLSDSGLIELDKSFRNGYSKELDANSNRWPLVKGVLTAGLFPSICRVDHLRTRSSFFTRNDGLVKPHPGSTNDLRLTSFDHKWVLYYEKVKSTGLFLHDTTQVSPMAICLFGGPIEIGDDSGRLQFISRKMKIVCIETADGKLGLSKNLPENLSAMPWVYFEDIDNTGEVAQGVRLQIEARMSRALMHPSSFPLSESHYGGKELLEIVVKLLESAEMFEYHKKRSQTYGEYPDDEDDEDEDVDDDEYVKNEVRQLIANNVEEIPQAHGRDHVNRGRRGRGRGRRGRGRYGSRVYGNADRKDRGYQERSKF